MKIRNYACKQNEQKLLDEIPFAAEDVFSDRKKYKVALELLSKNNSFVFAPLTNTIEAELQGATVTENSFIRVKNPLIQSVDDLASLKPFNYEVPHYKILSECLQMHYDKPLIYEMSGIYTFLSFIISIEQVFRAFRKNADLQNTIIKKVLENYFSFIQKLKSFNLKIISLADPVASVYIIGSNELEKIIENFYIPLIKYILDKTNFSIYLCPKLLYALEDLNKVKATTINIQKTKTQDAIINMLDTKKIFGNICINANTEIETVKIFSLNEDDKAIFNNKGNRNE